MVDYYLLRRRELNVADLYQENGEFRFHNGWNIRAFIAFAIGALFSSVLPMATNILPTWWATYGWFFGVAIGGGVYFVLLQITTGFASPHISIRPDRKRKCPAL